MRIDDSESTRERLLTAGARLLWQHSYFATTVDDICRLADARKGSFYHYFASKLALALDVIATQWTRVKTEVYDAVEHTSPRGLARLRALQHRLNDLSLPSRAELGPVVLGSLFGHIGQETAHQDEALRRAVAAVFDAQAAWIERCLVDAEALGELPPGDSHRRARQVLAQMEGAWLLAKVADDPGLFLHLVNGLPPGMDPPVTSLPGPRVAPAAAVGRPEVVPPEAPGSAVRSHDLSSDPSSPSRPAAALVPVGLPGERSGSTPRPPALPEFD